MQVQGWDGGCWQSIGGPLTLGTSSRTVIIPERFTGRNININYHDGHVSELQRSTPAPTNAVTPRRRRSSMTPPIG